jgi:hypothetical protein
MFTSLKSFVDKDLDPVLLPDNELGLTVYRVDMGVTGQEYRFGFK